MSKYDEDLYENPFFVSLSTHHRSLYERATASRWVICIPKCSCLKNCELVRQDFEDHILIPSKDNEAAYTTVSKHKVEIEVGKINLGSALKANKVDILFEETFYNSKDESYRVVCVSGLFNRMPMSDVSEESGLEQGFSRPPVTYEDCINILWGQQGSAKTRENLDKMLKIFCGEYQRFEGSQESIPSLADLVSSHVTKAMQIVLKDSHIKKIVKQNDIYMVNLKIAMEMYLMNAVHKHLFTTITACVKSVDALINKMTRNLVDIRLHHLEIRREFEENLPFAKKEVARLNQYSTPLGRILCLKRVVTALTKPLFKPEDSQTSEDLVMTSDDFLPLLIYLIIKSQIPNWTANLMYMKYFQMAKMTESDEFSFYLATVEAALDYIRSGNLKAAKPLGHIEGGYSRQTSGSATSSREKFFQYVQYGDEAAVKMLLKTQKPTTDDLSSKLCHPLCTCEKCSEITVRSTQNSGAVSVTARDDMGRTALHTAAFYGQGFLIDILAKHGCVVDATDYLGCTPLHLASQKGYQNIILLLVHFGADIGALDNEGNTPLHLCAKNGHEDCVKAILFLDILKNKLNVNAQNDMGDTPLHMAARWGYDGIVSFLLESEADPRIRNRKRQTPYNVAQNADIKKELQNFMAEPPPMIKPSSLPVSSSVITPPPSSTSPCTQLPQSTLQSDTVTPSPGIRTPLGFEIVDVKPARSSIQLIDNSSREMMSPTTPAVASLDQGDARQIDKLFKAIANKDLPLVQYYFGWVEEGSSSSEDSPVSPPTTPLPADNIASRLCHPLCQCDKCKHIQKHSSVNILHINCQNRKGYAPLHTCIIENNMEVLAILLKKGAFVNIQTRKHITPLHLACFHNSYEIVEMLVSHGANVNLQDQHGEIPLHLAAAKTNIKIVKYLIQHSSSVNLGNVNGNTCLHHAAVADAVELVRVLLDNGAIPDVVNKHNKSPADLTKNSVIVEMLKKKEAELHNKSLKGEREQPQGADKLKEMVSTLDDQHVETLQQIAEGIKTFNKLSKLKRSKTFDHSAPSLNNASLKLSLSIQHFDKTKSLKRASTSDRSSPLLSPLERSLSIKRFNSGSLKHVETVDKSDPLYLYSLSRTFSSYHNYSDSPDFPFSPFEDLSKDLVSFETSVPTSLHSIDAKTSEFEESNIETGNSEKSFDVIELPEEMENLNDLDCYNLDKDKCETIVQDSENVVAQTEIDQEFPGESQNADLNSLIKYTSDVSINQNEVEVKATEYSDSKTFQESAEEKLSRNSSAQNCHHNAVSNSAANENVIEKSSEENENVVEKRTTEDEYAAEERPAKNENVVEERIAENENLLKERPAENEKAVKEKSVEEESIVQERMVENENVVNERTSETENVASVRIAEDRV